MRCLKNRFKKSPYKMGRRSKNKARQISLKNFRIVFVKTLKRKKSRMITDKMLRKMNRTVADQTKLKTKAVNK